MLLGAMGQEVLVVRYAAGYSEDNVVETRWTPLTRLALHEDERGTYLLLDNTSASEVILDEETRTRRTTEVNRSLVYQLHDPPARVAVLAASAGPEVAVAQHFGFDNVHAIDIAPQIGDMVSARFPDSPTNPFVVGNTVRVVMDGRAAIAHAREPFDIIQMVHANLHSSAGLLANAWSPSLLETREAFETYLDHLAPGGTLSFGRGPRTDFLARSATAALRRRGVSQPARHIAYVTGGATVMLVKAEPFTPAERDRIESVLARARASGRKQQLAYDPVSPEPGAARGVLWGRPLMTDDRPYMERPEEVRAILGESVKRLLGGGEGEVPPVTVIYHALMIQAAFVAAAGLLLLILPALRRDAVGLGPIRGVGWGLGYVACLGYGYLAIETVLLHELVLFVGHPTYAITVVILAMLLSSGFGSWLVGRMEPSGLSARLRLVLAAILLLGAACTLGLSPLLQAAFFGLPIAVRVVVTGVVLFPLGALMGMPFPLALRILHPSAAGMVPWAWALNGWTSVVASLGTVLLARLYGYQAAMWVALGAYALAWLISGRIQQIGAERKTSEIPA
jgi:hypothetical protein